MSDAFDRLKEEFLLETEETLSAFRGDLLRFAESSPSGSLEPRHVDRAFRTAHSLKGVLGMFGLDDMARVAHALESVLDEIRAGRLAADRPALDVLLEGNEALHELLSRARGTAGTTAEADLANRVAARLDLLAKKSAPDAGAPDPNDALGVLWGRLPAEAAAAMRATVDAGRTVAVVRAPGPLGGAARDERAEEELASLLRAWGAVHARIDDDTPAGDAAQASTWYVVSGDSGIFALAKSVGACGEVLPCDAERVVRAHASAPAPAELPAPVAASRGPASLSPADGETPASTGTVRVRVERIDGLLEGLAGLLHAKMVLDDAVLSAPTADRMRRTELTQILRRLDREIRSLQEDVLDVRLVALGALVPKLERIAWSAAREAGKSVRLSSRVGDVEVDKEIVDALVAPLAHLVRNAIDHGIEDGSTRRQRGKDPTGTIRLEAQSAGPEAIVEVVDDGAGIDWGRVLEKARSRGLLPRDREPDRDEVMEALFSPGFSTRDAATSLSGRGVGLDAARDAVHRLGGALELVTGGTGTRVTIRIPTTRAILAALLVRARGEPIVLPLAPITQVVKVHPGEVEQRDGEESLMLEGRRLPVVDLGLLLGIGKIDRTRERVLGVHIAGSGREMILLVDEVGARRDVVTRRLGLVRSAVPGIVGTTELGDGRAVLLLDPAALPDPRRNARESEESTR